LLLVSIVLGCNGSNIGKGQSAVAGSAADSATSSWIAQDGQVCEYLHPTTPDGTCPVEPAWQDRVKP
jgi:hypothetical protein